MVRLEQFRLVEGSGQLRSFECLACHSQNIHCHTEMLEQGEHWVIQDELKDSGAQQVSGMLYLTCNECRSHETSPITNDKGR